MYFILVKQVLDTLYKLLKIKPEKEGEDINIIYAKDGLLQHPTRVWKKRDVKKITGVIVHQSASNGSMYAVAKYHVTPTSDRDGDGVIEAWERNHISPLGCPGICYTFGIEDDGMIYLMNDLDDVTWHAKKFNSTHVGVVLFGNFSGPSWKGEREPSQAQLDSLVKLLNYLKFELLAENDIPYERFIGHGEGYAYKANCPGNIIMDVLKEWRGDNGS